jgi:hypothetical protein
MQYVDSLQKRNGSLIRCYALCTRQEMGHSSQLIDYNQHIVKANALM